MMSSPKPSRWVGGLGEERGGKGLADMLLTIIAVLVTTVQWWLQQ